MIETQIEMSKVHKYESKVVSTISYSQNISIRPLVVLTLERKKALKTHYSFTRVRAANISSGSCWPNASQKAVCLLSLSNIMHIYESVLYYKVNFDNSHTKSF